MEEDWAGQEEEHEEEEEVQGDHDEEEDILDVGEEVAPDDRGALLMRFCPHDSSMLYPSVSLPLFLRGYVSVVFGCTLSDPCAIFKFCNTTIILLLYSIGRQT
jgi:hypothetical protein